MNGHGNNFENTIIGIIIFCFVILAVMAPDICSGLEKIGSALVSLIVSSLNKRE